MMKNNLLLFGSYSRGDNTFESDIDLLSVSNGYTKRVSVGKINLISYNAEKLTSISTSGSLFVYHLINEGKILADEDNVFKNILYDSFKLRESYSEDRQFAFNLANKIYNIYDKIKNYEVAHKALAWSLRTIFASIGAEKGEAIFSKEKISKRFGELSFELLSIKNNTASDKGKATQLLEWLNNIDLKIHDRLIKFRPDL